MRYMKHAGIYLLLLLCTVACQNLSPLIHPSPAVTPAQNRSLDGYTEERWTLTSPDGRWRAEGLVATPDNSGDEYYVELRLLQTNGSQLLTTIWTPIADWRPFGLGYTTPRLVYWSTDGRYLYYTNAPRPDGCALFVNASDLFQLDLSTGKVHEVLPPNATWVLDAAPDGTIAYVAQQTIVFFELNNDTRREIPLDVDRGNVQLGNLVWSPDSQRVVFAVAYDPCIPSSWQHAIYIADRQQLTATLAWPSDDRRLQVERWLDHDHLVLVDREDNEVILEIILP